MSVEKFGTCKFYSRKFEHGAEGGSRTRTSLRTTDFKSAASAIPPPRQVVRNSNIARISVALNTNIPDVDTSVRHDAGLLFQICYQVQPSIAPTKDSWARQELTS